MQSYYDDNDPLSIETYGKAMIGMTFNEIITAYDAVYSSNNSTSSENVKNKGNYGLVVEKYYFGYTPNSISQSDFPRANVELKVTPYEIKSNGELKAGERLVLTMISNTRPVEIDFYHSHVWNKCRLMLLVCYWRNKTIKSTFDYPIKYVSLFTPPKEDLLIIINDYNSIINKIVAGRAHELSESDTMYLGACTKGSTAQKSIQAQYYPPHTPAKRRAFCLKTSYMSSILNKLIKPGFTTYETIVKSDDVLKNTTFEDFVIKTIGQYSGLTDRKLSNNFGLDYSNNKSQWISLAFRMLGIKSNQATEFIKANITIKAIRLEDNGTMRESSSLPTICFKELVEEIWEESSLYRYFEETKFLFVVFKRHRGNYVLRGAQLWNMPFQDLNETVFQGWNDTKKIVKQGVQLTKRKSGNEVENNLPKLNSNRIIHVRPHAQKRYYDFGDGEIIGEDKNNGDELPDGRWMTKQSFWLNNSYILSQLDENLK